MHSIFSSTAPPPLTSNDSGSQLAASRPGSALRRLCHRGRAGGYFAGSRIGVTEYRCLCPGKRRPRGGSQNTGSQNGGGFGATQIQSVVGAPSGIRRSQSISSHVASTNLGGSTQHWGGIVFRWETTISWPEAGFL
jgi:hypothetical protein